MCGITGKVYLDPERIIEEADLKRMNDVIIHRGPDDEGIFIRKNVGLGFRRLSIIDLSSGHQPLSNDDQSLTIIFNGEIYNYLEQKEALIKKGHRFRTTSDTEVILHLYEEYGVDCLQHMRGMFAFSIWDERNKKLFCARDRFGIKPFYYYKDQEKFIFGSEIKSLLQSGPIDRTLSEDAIDSYFAFGYITSNLSIYKHIHKLPPSHYLLLSFGESSNFEIRRYWNIEFTPDYSKTEEYWKAQIEESLSESVRLHMLSDVPLGAFLSGGIDSSAVVAMMARNSNQPIKTFSIGFKEARFNELDYARETARRYHCEHHEQIVEPESISLLPKLVRAYDEPFADSSAIPTYFVSKLAREFVTVALSGDGGDEMFAGYNIYTVLRKLHSYPFNFNSPAINNLLWGTLHKLIPHKTKGKGSSYFLSHDKNLLGAYVHVWSTNERQKLIPGRSERNLSASEEFKADILRKAGSLDFVSGLQYLDLQTYMVDDILTKVDRVSMLNSLEVRVPIIDHVFAELSFKIPSHFKLNGKVQKHIFRQAMIPHIEPNIINLPKQGFSIPLSLWFKEDLKTYVKDVLLSGNTLYSSYLSKDFVRKTIENSNLSRRDFSSRIWSLIFFEEWLRYNSEI